MTAKTMTVSDVAGELSVSDDTVRGWINQKRLPGYALPGSRRQPIYRVLRKDFERFLKAHQAGLNEARKT